MKNDETFRRQVEQRAKRMAKADRERPTVIGQAVYLGTLGLLFVIPMVGGAYLGLWLDSMLEGYSLRWTLSLLMLGVAIGALNVWLFVRR